MKNIEHITSHDYVERKREELSNKIMFWAKTLDETNNMYDADKTLKYERGYRE